MKKFLIAIFTIFLTANFSFAIQAKVEKYEIDFPTAYELMFNNNNSIKAILEEINAKKYKIRKKSMYLCLNYEILKTSDGVEYGK